MLQDDFNKELLKFLDASPTPFHAVSYMQNMLETAGFEGLDEKASWQLEEGKKYYVTRNGSSIIAFTLPAKAEGFVMLGAHTDSPNLKIKPNPVIISNGVVQLGVEPYGGLLMNPWFDRDLSIAGRANYLDDAGRMQESLIDFIDPVAVIPSLAIHLDRDANKNRSVNAQTDIVPLVASGDYFDFEAMILKALEKEGRHAEKLLSHELSFYDTQKASVIGLDREFIASARLDNLLSCYVATQVLCRHPDQPLLMICSDHEEVGSESVSGAAGPFLENILRRIGGTYEKYAQLLRHSMLISCDNAHAVHPNFASKHDANHAPKINRGPVVKINANQRYASNSTSISRFMHAAEKAGKELQHFVTRSDMGCGSTIGPITATRLGIETIDVGMPTFAMHSIRELAGSEDALTLYEIIVRLSERDGFE